MDDQEDIGLPLVEFEGYLLEVPADLPEDTGGSGDIQSVPVEILTR